MTSAHKEHIKSLKGPDQFQVRAMAALDWGVKNSRILAVAVAPVALVIAGVFVVRYVQQRAKDSRIDDLGKIQVVYEAETKKAADARQVLTKQLADLDAQIGKSMQPDAAAKKDPKAPPAAKDPKALPAKAPDSALLLKKMELTKKAEELRPDHAASGAQFLEYFKNHDQYAEGWLAGMEAARIDTEQEKYADARGVLESVETKAKANPFYETEARFALIGVLEELGDYDKGLSEASELEKSVDPDLKAKVLLAKGRLQMLKNAKADAKTTFTTIIDTYATSPEAQKARSLSALLN